ncbi:MAG: imidazole glycerol phosphate synthase subunit HisH [Sphingomonadales bacterium]|nr:imidazole glycerol phosphate synthase subunit HisH [Sphingomonadales bacterium]
MSMVIVDSGCANLASVVFAFERLGAVIEVSKDKDVIKRAPRVVLPGVGAAGFAMDALQKADLVETLQSLTQPILGICLGMQLLFDKTDEDDVPCLGMIGGRIRKFPATIEMPVPHMGWNTLEEISDNCPLLNGVDDGSFAYFVHSYYRAPGLDMKASTPYSVPVASVVQKNNVFGCQFHPERSSDVGAMVLKNFMTLEGSA